jgi:hypothetical protein
MADRGVLEEAQPQLLVLILEVLQLNQQNLVHQELMDLVTLEELILHRPDMPLLAVVGRAEQV